MKNAMLKNTPASEPWRMLMFLLLAQLLVAFVGRSVAPLGILIGADLSLSNSQIGMLPAALFLGQTIAAVPAGILTDAFGSRRLLVAAALCLGIAFAAATQLSHFAVLLLLVAIGGAGYGSMHPITNKGIMYWFTLKKRGTAMGIKQTGVTAGAALAGLILLPLGAEYGWRPVLFGASILLMLGGILSYFLYRDPPEQNVMKKASAGATYKSMFPLMKNKALMLVSISAFGLSGSQMALNTYLVLFAHDKLGISLFLSGLLLVVSEVSGSAGRIVWGVASDALFHGNRVLILLIIAVLTAVSSLGVAFTSQASFWELVPLIILFGFSLSGFNGIWMNLASEIVPREQSGISSGLSLSLGSLGVIVVPPVFGLLVDSTGSFANGWLFIAAIMVFVIAMLSWLVVWGKRGQNKTS